MERQIFSVILFDDKVDFCCGGKIIDLDGVWVKFYFIACILIATGQMACSHAVQV